MKLLILVLAALGFLVTPASGGGTRCGRKVPGHCRLQCHSSERAMFMCDRYKLCCVVSSLVPEPIKPPPARRPLCRQTTKSKQQQTGMRITPAMSVTPKPLSPPVTRRIARYQFNYQ